MAIIYEGDYDDGSGTPNCTRGSEHNMAAVAGSRTGSTNPNFSLDAEQALSLEGTWCTEANNPNSADWPNGTYRFSIDVTVLGADSSFRMDLNRLNSSCTLQENLITGTEQSTTGNHNISSTVDPSAGNATDVFEGAFYGANSHMHSAQSLIIDVGSGTNPTELEGPWAGATQVRREGRYWMQGGRGMYRGMVKT